MAHDYAKKKSNKPTSGAQRNKTPSVSLRSLRIKYFFIGVIVTVASQLAYIAAQKSPHVEKIVQETKKTVLPTEKTVAKPDITFYQTLPKMDVKVDVDVVPDVQNAPYNAVLQAGSFKNKDDANQQRAEVALLGLKATIEETVNDKGTTWYRVIVGPFSSRSDMNKARNTLANNKLPTLVLKR